MGKKMDFLPPSECNLTAFLPRLQKGCWKGTKLRVLFWFTEIQHLRQKGSEKLRPAKVLEKLLNDKLPTDVLVFTLTSELKQPYSSQTYCTYHFLKSI